MKKNTRGRKRCRCAERVQLQMCDIRSLLNVVVVVAASPLLCTMMMMKMMMVQCLHFTRQKEEASQHLS